jgi:uncharacterized protein (TIGR00369 family)
MRMAKEDFKRFMESAIPFHTWLGMRLEHIEHGKVIMRMPFREEMVGDVARPALHGGIVAALIDAAAGAAAITYTEPVDRTNTVDLRIDYLRPAPKSDLLATAYVVRGGSRFSVVDVVVEIEGEGQKPIAQGRGVFAIRKDVGHRDSISGGPDNVSKDRD